jgi:hypothetical protein
MAVICGCGRAFETEVWIALNVTTDPELRQLLLSGELNKVECPVCGRESRVDHELLYVDMARHLLIAMLPRTQGQSWAQAKRDFERRSIAQKELWSRAAGLTADEVQGGLYVRRMVFGFNELREKVFLFDKGLDDRAVELLKLGLAWRERDVRPPATPADAQGPASPASGDESVGRSPVSSATTTPVGPVAGAGEPLVVAGAAELRGHVRPHVLRATPVATRPLPVLSTPPPPPADARPGALPSGVLTDGMDARASEHIRGGQPEILDSVRRGGEVLLEGVEARELHFAVLPVAGVPLRLSVARDAYEAVLDGVMGKDPFGNLGRWPYVAVRALLSPPEPEPEPLPAPTREPAQTAAPDRPRSPAEPPAPKKKRPWWKFWT